MKKFLSKKTFMSASLTAMMLTMLGTNAIVYEPLPSRTDHRGFYYWLDMADYPNLLQSNMPLDMF